MTLKLKRELVLVSPQLSVMIEPIGYEELSQKWPLMLKKACERLADVRRLKSELHAWIKGENVDVSWYAAVPFVSHFPGLKTNLNFLSWRHTYVDNVYLESLKQKFEEMKKRYKMFSGFIPHRTKFKHKPARIKKVRCMACETRDGRGRKKLTYHHILPRSILGGLGLKDGNDAFNIAVLCKACHTELEALIHRMEKFVLFLSSERRPTVMLADYFILLSRYVFYKKDPRGLKKTTMVELGMLKKSCF
jgi:hypothetical protein